MPVKLTIYYLGRKTYLMKTEDELAVKKMRELDKQTASGKRKTISAKEALGEYAELLK